MSAKPNVFVSLTLFSTEAGGRKSCIFGRTFRCPVWINDDNLLKSSNHTFHDCAFILDSVGSLWPGHSYENIAVEFLCPELVLPKLKIGTKIGLFEGRRLTGEAIITKFT